MTFGPLHIFHIIPGVGPRSFGLGPVAINLAREQNTLGGDSNIWCLDTRKDILWASECNDLPASRIRDFPNTGPVALGLSIKMERVATDYESSDNSIVHQHGIWSGISRVTNIFRQLKRVPTIVAPHGSLERWALKRSMWKKRVALVCYERENLHNASCLHACSEQEIAGFRDFGLTNPIAVIPNGISTDWLKSKGSAVEFRKRFNIPSGKRIMLFLSRITPIKGLLQFLDAIQANRQHLDDWLLIIAGSDEFGHQLDLEKRIKHLHLEKHIRFTGLLIDQVKRDAFSAADLFVLPTLRENYGIVVAEALGAGIPVLTTKGAPWKDLVTNGCGWWVDAEVGAITEALKEALSYPPEQLRIMGQRGKDHAVSEYVWTRSAKMTIELYEWLLGRREKPGFVVIG